MKEWQESKRPVFLFQIFKPLRQCVHRFGSCFFPPVGRSECEPLVHMRMQAILPPTLHDFKQASSSLKFQCQNCKSTVIVPIAILLCPPPPHIAAKYRCDLSDVQEHHSAQLRSTVETHHCLHCAQGLALLSCVSGLCVIAEGVPIQI